MCVDNSACTRVELRGQPGNHFPPSIFTWVWGIGRSQTTRLARQAPSLTLESFNSWSTVSISQVLLSEDHPRSKQQLSSYHLLSTDEGPYLRCPCLSLRTTLGGRQFPISQRLICQRSQVRRELSSGLMGGHSLYLNWSHHLTTPPPGKGPFPSLPLIGPRIEV